MNKAENVLKDIENITKKHFLPIVGRKKGALLEFLIKRYEPKKILEIGTLVGYSAILMAKHLNGYLISIDVNNNNKIAEENIKKAGLKNIKLISGDAIELIPSLKEKFDFIFIDASKSEYLSYLKLLEKYNKIQKGSIIAADNVKIFANRMKDYLEYVRNSGNYDSKYYDFVDDGVEVSIKK